MKRLSNQIHSIDSLLIQRTRYLAQRSIFVKQPVHIISCFDWNDMMTHQKHPRFDI